MKDKRGSQFATNLRVPPLALSALLAPAVGFAQSGDHTPAQGSQSDPVAEIVVTGLRHSIQTSQELKQNSDVIVDSISAIDIGALPDRSVTEALQRISGVSIDH